MVGLTLAQEGRLARVTTSRTDPDGLAALVERAREAVRLRPADPDFPGLAPPAPVSPVDHWDDATAGATPDQRAEVVAGFVAAAGEFGNLLQAQLAQLNQKRAQLEDEIARRRQALVEADRDVKTLEKLRERQHQQHELASRRADQKLLDDAAARQVERESHR